MALKISSSFSFSPKKGKSKYFQYHFTFFSYSRIVMIICKSSSDFLLLTFYDSCRKHFRIIFAGRKFEWKLIYWKKNRCRKIILTFANFFYYNKFMTSIQLLSACEVIHKQLFIGSVWYSTRLFLLRDSFRILLSYVMKFIYNEWKNIRKSFFVRKNKYFCYFLLFYLFYKYIKHINIVRKENSEGLFLNDDVIIAILWTFPVFYFGR